ncbi:lipoprotein N-acyltransferase Lnb domain-containing protein [Polaribacter cellanae]|uniref:DUF4105 domain-containing protein n=1 Tax=Polaribacter cellanae TaxID=2818493 RepID=A0A975CNW7_9FLAO|nr:DUF4105 domain-containing protein [Polaribacter cellanae]QTE23063.1 DUF4105 domain-containing protein [Polaribacter cellanae]
MYKRLLLLLILCSLSTVTYCQLKLSVYSEVSIVTAGPGSELYEAFGHSAIRVKDPLLKLDLIYNYGMFDFNAPNFYINFAQGKLYYKLQSYDFKYFLRGYQIEKRWVKQQVLNLNQAEKQAFFMYLQNNARPENATYLYDPFFNNCATILRDITTLILKNKVNFKAVSLESSGKTLRELMNAEIPHNTWGNFGINLATGTILDKKREVTEYMYLPDYVFKNFKNATIKIAGEIKPLVEKEETLLNFKEIKSNILFFNPILVFIILAVLAFFITYKDIKKKTRTRSLDFIIFFITGLIGVILAYLWLFSSHKIVPNNFNILWAFAPNIIMAFFIFKKITKIWLQKYILILIGFILMIPILWIARVQSFPVAVIPLLILFLGRYVYLYTFLLTSKK